jgi:uncharacterized protein
MLKFELDLAQAKTNQRKHHVAFKEAANVVRDRMSIIFYDPNHSEEEDRLIIVGFSTACKGNLLNLFLPGICPNRN